MRPCIVMHRNPEPADRRPGPASSSPSLSAPPRVAPRLASAALLMAERAFVETPSALAAAVLDLPGVEEGVPGDAAEGVAGGPFALVRAEPSDDRRPDLLHRSFFGRRRAQLQAQRGGVGGFRAEDVLDDLVPVAAPAPRSFAKFRGCPGDDLV